MFPLLLKYGLCLLPFLGFNSSYGFPFDLAFEAEGFAGYREDGVDWNIPGTEGQANILSELTWKDLRMAQVGGQLRVSGRGSLYARAMGDFAWIKHGVNQDSDFRGDNRTDEYSRSVNDAGKGETYDLTAAAGLQIIRFCGVRAGPVLGYAYSQQHLHMFDGKQVVCVDNPAREGKEIEGLDSTYHNRWKGPFTGFDVMLCLGNWTLNAEWEYHWTHFVGKGVWNLRDDLCNEFFDRANGRGTHTNVRLNYALIGGISCGVGVDYWNFNAHDGSSEVYLPVTYYNFQGEVYKEVWEWCKFGFNEVNWHSFRVNANLSLCF